MQCDHKKFIIANQTKLGAILGLIGVTLLASSATVVVSPFITTLLQGLGALALLPLSVMAAVALLEANNFRVYGVLGVIVLAAVGSLYSLIL